MTPITVAIVDDQPLMRFGLRALFDSEDGRRHGSGRGG